MNPSVFSCQVPVVAISTAPGFGSEVSQHPMDVDAVVVGILGSVHHDATLSGTPPSNADTICHGGTLRFDGFEISTTPLESVAMKGVLLLDMFPNALHQLLNVGRPSVVHNLQVCRVGDNARIRERRRGRVATSALLSFSAKKCWLTRTSLS